MVNKKPAKKKIVKTSDVKEVKKSSKKVSKNEVIKEESRDKVSKKIKNFDYIKCSQKVLPIILILIVMAFAFYFRIGPVTLDGLNQRIETNIYANVKGFIEQDVNQKYPNLNDFYKQELIDKEYQKVLDTGSFDYYGQTTYISDLVAQVSNSTKSAFQADNGQTYLNAIDPYHFYKITENYMKTGNQGNTLKVNDEGREVPYISYKLAPKGVYPSEDISFQTYMESFMFNLYGVDETSTVGEKMGAIFLIPVIFVILSVIPIYFIIRKFSNDIFAFFGSLALVSVGTFVSRTIAGFVDTDAYNVFFPLMVIMFLVYGFLSRNVLLTIILGVFAGLFQGLFMIAWSKGWFIFVFAFLALISYLGYIVLADLIAGRKLENLKAVIINDLSVLLSFGISSYIFTYFFIGVDLFKKTYQDLFASVSGIAGISQSNIWPNVLSSVAELNPASFATIISSIGGKLIFVIAMTAVVFLILDYKSKNDKMNKYRRLLFVASIFWFVLIVFGNLFVNLIANSSLLFLVILFLPIGFSFILSLLNDNKSDRLFLALVLSFWIAGTIYMSFNGVRFILLLAPAFAIAFGIGLYYLSMISNEFFIKEFDIKNNYGKIIPGIILVSSLFLIAFIPMAKSAIMISENTMPNFDDAWYNAMYKIRDNSQENAIITSWWDFGHFFAAISDRGVTFDGGSQTTPRAHWVGKLLMEDEEISHDILRMLVCGGNEAFNTMNDIVDGDSADAVLINKIIYDTFGKDANGTRDILLNNKYYDFTSEEVDSIMKLLYCDVPVEDFLITSEDMVGKAGVWAHWGSWDFRKKYVYDTYKTKSAQEIADNIDENVSLVEDYISELDAIDIRVEIEGVKKDNLVNQWFAPYPSYVPIQGKYIYPCENKNNTIACQNGIGVDMNTGTVLSALHEDVTFNNLVYPNYKGELTVIKQKDEGDLDVVLIPSSKGYNILLAQKPLGTSLFTKLFYLDGFDTKYFEKFDDVNSATGVRVSVWKALWDINETKSVDVKMNELIDSEVDSISSNVSSENIGELIDNESFDNLSN